MSLPIVSVIVTSYNFGRYVGSALASVRNQTFADYEVIVLDDGSTDESLAVIEPFLGDRRFRLVRQDHLGQVKTKNRGLELARAPFIAFLDADDVWMPEKLEKQLATFDTEPDLGVVCTRRTLIDADDYVLAWPDNAPPRGQVVNALFQQNFVCFSSAMLRAEATARLGRFHERIDLAIDYDFWLRIARHYLFGVVDEPLVAYRVGHVNLSRRQFDRLHVALLIMRRFERHIDRPTFVTRRTRARANAETFAHMGVIARGFSRRVALGWLSRALWADLTYGPAWRNLLAAAAPDKLRRIVRRLRGTSRAWERRCHTLFNQPETIL